MATGGSLTISHSSEHASIAGRDGSDTTKSENGTWELFSNWACCVCVVTFDLELGQALEVCRIVCSALCSLFILPWLQSIIPADYKLSDTEKSNVCYLAFPDSNSGELQCVHVRMYYMCVHVHSNVTCMYNVYIYIADMHRVYG